jgi:hypothetical protein
MADVQKYFEKFHEAIKVKRFEENQTLIEKRDIILGKLKKGLKDQFEEKGEPVPSYVTFNQGSYEMGTGVIPHDGDFDIDVGVSFLIAKEDYPDPVDVKRWVYDALEGHTRNVEVRRPCVTVFYQKDKEPVYHVDLAIYSDESSNGDGKMYLAKGKLGSSSDNKIWEVSDPKGVTKIVKERYSGDDKSQFIRIIRGLKRWKDFNFTTIGNSAPIGIGLTFCAYWWHQPQKTLTDFVAYKYTYNDLKAMRIVVSSMINNFVTYSDGSETFERLKVNLPVEPLSELFDKMTNIQMANFKTELTSLLEALDKAESEVDPVKACEILQKLFGSDFPVPTKPDTGERKSAAIVSSSASANV